MEELLITNTQLYRPYHPSSNKLFQLRVAGGRIVAIEQNGYKREADKVFDAKGRVLAASFKDSHLHLLRYSLMQKERDLRRVHTWRHLQELLRDEYNRQSMETNEWLVGRGLIDNHFTDREILLSAKDLDYLEIDRPIFLLHQDGHECVLNSKALAIVQQEELLEKSHSAFIEKDAEGNWTGRFKDTAVHFIKMKFRSKGVAEAKEALRETLPRLAEYGITHVDSDDLNYVGSYSKVWQTYTELDKEEGLPFGAYLHHYVYSIEDMRNYLKNSEKRSGEGEGNVRVGAFKVFVDGTYRLHTAAMNLPFEDSHSCGTLIYEQAELNEMLKLADENHMQVAMHCIGDRAVETAAKAIIHANPHRNPMRHRIIHMQNTRWDLLRLLRRHKIPVETQPGFLQKEYADYKKWLGEDREKLAQVGKSLIDNEVIFTSSSDAPIGSLNPHEHIFAAVNRTNDMGEPKGGWQPQEKISIDEAYESYCTTPAYVNHTDKDTGRLLPGYQADMMLLEQHPIEAGNALLNKIKVDALWYKGEMVFDRYD